MKFSPLLIAIVRCRPFLNGDELHIVSWPGQELFEGNGIPG